MRTTVVVVTWRGLRLVGACLDALAAQTSPHELLVVDNASDDGTADVLAAHPSRPRVLRLQENRGYAGALAAVLPSVATPFMAWLNDDARPRPQWLAALEAALDAYPEAAAAGSTLVHPDGTPQSTGVRLTPLGYGYDDTVGAGQEPFGFCGGAALLRTAALRAAGGVPAGFFCYYEDTDTAWRLRLAGHRIAHSAGAVVVHAHGATSRLDSPTFHAWNERNRLLMLLRCAPATVAARELARFAAITAVLPLRRRPTGPAPTDPAPTDPAPTDPAPTDPAPTDPAPTDPAPTDSARPPNHRLPLRLRVLAAVAARLPSAMWQRAGIGRRAVLTRTAVWRAWAGN